MEKKQDNSLAKFRKLFEDIFSEIELKLSSEADKTNLRSEIEAKKALYNAKIELKELFSQLAQQALTQADPLATQKYQSLTQPLKKNLKKKLDKSFQDANWAECIKIIEKLRNAYQALLESTLNLIEYEETFKVYRYIQEFINSFDNKNLIQEFRG